MSATHCGWTEGSTVAQLRLPAFGMVATPSRLHTFRRAFNLERTVQSLRCCAGSRESSDASAAAMAQVADGMDADMAALVRRISAGLCRDVSMTAWACVPCLGCFGAQVLKACTLWSGAGSRLARQAHQIVKPSRPLPQADVVVGFAPLGTFGCMGSLLAWPSLRARAALLLWLTHEHR